MAPESKHEITELLAAWSGGQDEALNHLVTLVYPEVRQIARRHLGKRSLDHTLQSAAVANEAYLKLIRMRGIQCDSRAHFFALCAQIIRRILVSDARKGRCAKRGGGVAAASLEEALLGTRGRGVELVALDDALTALAKIDERKARVVELRFFGGLSVEETAEVLGISVETVMRDWKMAKVWLRRELTRTGGS